MTELIQPLNRSKERKMFAVLKSGPAFPSCFERGDGVVEVETGVTAKVLSSLLVLTADLEYERLLVLWENGTQGTEDAERFIRSRKDTGYYVSI